MYKLSYNISFAEWKRKWLLLLIINFCITPIEMLANYKIESSNYILRIASKDKGTRSHTDGFQRNNAKCLDEKGISRFVPDSSI